MVRIRIFQAGNKCSFYTEDRTNSQRLGEGEGPLVLLHEIVSVVVSRRRPGNPSSSQTKNCFNLLPHLKLKSYILHHISD